MFTIFRLYNDMSSVTETAFTMPAALTACAIYLEDPACINVKIWRQDNGKILFDYDHDFWEDK